MAVQHVVKASSRFSASLVPGANSVKFGQQVFGGCIGTGLELPGLDTPGLVQLSFGSSSRLRRIRGLSFWPK
jgi:hypothetical protein